MGPTGPIDPKHAYFFALLLACTTCCSGARLVFSGNLRRHCHTRVKIRRSRWRKVEMVRKGWVEKKTKVPNDAKNNRHRLRHRCGSRPVGGGSSSARTRPALVVDLVYWRSCNYKMPLLSCFLETRSQEHNTTQSWQVSAILQSPTLSDYFLFLMTLFQCL
nr:hypothetical protein Iba_chr06cCG14240 [Ipomoea batatas]